MKTIAAFKTRHYDNTGGIQSINYQVEYRTVSDDSEDKVETGGAAHIWKTSDTEWLGTCYGSKLYSFKSAIEADDWVHYNLEKHGVIVTKEGDQFPPSEMHKEKAE